MLFVCPARYPRAALVIKYIGSKRKLVPNILAAFGVLPDGAEILDLFSGTSRVGHALKRQGFAVTANDHTHFAATLARCYVAADRDEVEAPVRRVLAELMKQPPHDGWFTETYCRQSRYLRPVNGARIEGMRNHLAEMDLPADLEAIVLVSLMEAADRVDSTTGVQMAYLKKWAARSSNKVELRMPEVLPGPGTAWRKEAIDAASDYRGHAAYLDPPYNQHSYQGNYHLWETLVRWDEPETYGIAMKRIDCRTYKSPFNSKRRIQQAVREVIDALDTDMLIVSFNNEGFISRQEMEGYLADRGTVRVVELDYRRYVGAKIGIHDLKGRKVGKVSHLTNKELLFVAGTDSDRVVKAAKAANRPV